MRISAGLKGFSGKIMRNARARGDILQPLAFARAGNVSARQIFVFFCLLRQSILWKRIKASNKLTTFNEEEKGRTVTLSYICSKQVYLSTRLLIKRIFKKPFIYLTFQNIYYYEEVFIPFCCFPVCPDGEGGADGRAHRPNVHAGGAARGDYHAAHRTAQHARL